MKKIFMFCLVCLSSLFLFVSCEDENINSIFNKADKVYISIKTIVTDNEVYPLLSNDVLDRLKKAEKAYLSAKKAKDLKDGRPLELLADSADEIINILETINKEKFDKYKNEITLIRVTAKVFRNNLILEE